MRVATIQEAQRIDFESVRVTGQESEVFMEAAGQGMVEALCGRGLIQPRQPIAILCGPGHNGGDGFVIGRALMVRGFKGVEIFYANESAGANTNADLWHRQFSDLILNGIEPKKIEKAHEIDLSKYEVIIDALFGIGLNRPLGEPWISLIGRINISGKLIVSVDSPSGLHCDRGVPWPVAVRANWTLTCEIAKAGFFLQEGPACVGHVLRIPVGFPRDIVLREAKSVRLVTKKIIPSLFPARSAVTNKSKQGHLLIVGGAPGMLGALKLCADAASRLGVGYVTICSRAAARSWEKLPADYLNLSVPDFFKSDLQKYSAIIVGPGLGLSPQTAKILRHLRATHERVLVDADALSQAAKMISVDGDRKGKVQELLCPFPENWLVTPHAGELSRLVQLPAQALEADRLGAVDRASQLLNCVVLFKGFRTIVSNSKLKFIIGAGNAALAKAGTGDVLAGFIGSLMAQGLRTDEAAVVGALLHGDLADQWVRSGRGDFSLRASDLVKLTRLIGARSISGDL